MSFDVEAEAYGRFMGRYSEPLAAAFADVVAPEPGWRALDVGAGTGAVAALLSETLGSAAVAAVDPSPPFVAAMRQRLPGVDVREAAAESLPFPDGTFDLTVAQLVVHFMTDPVAGLAEMARVTTAGGIVAASVWDFAGERAPLSLFWRVARELDPGAAGESELAGAREGHLAELLRAAGLHGVRGGELTVEVAYADPDDWWRPYTLGVGPAGAYVAGLDDPHREALRRRAIEALGEGPGVISATAWMARGVA
ncbi:class I SAM-dependent methyltransferase [Agromyces sp. MMS24-JH15]|uniref:class I SAM-dependent methyltransferase n=1 Tax=Agromyces sp. MMS24-JH15 TaxID=3243765 RepID=UPI003749B83C